MTLYFLSDIHLRFNDDESAQRFCSFLEAKVKSEDILILGGDVFDLFVGNKKIFHTQFSSVLASLKLASGRGTQIHYLEGNHDFHLNRVFDGDKNITVYANSFSVQADGKKIWISHGDEIDREDYGYRFLRFVTRSLPLQIFISFLPDAILAKIGVWSSKQSRKYNTDRLSNAATERTKALFRDYAKQQIGRGYDFVFLGHSHLRDHLKIAAPKGDAEYVNLGFSSQKLLYARYTPAAGQLELAAFPE